MCREASFVLTRDGVYWLRESDSHDQIIKTMELNADGCRGPNIVRVELTPPQSTDFDCGDIGRPFEEWQYAVDQTEVPKWYDAQEAEARVRAELPKWYDSKVITFGSHDFTSGSHYAAGDARLNLYGTASAVISGNAFACCSGMSHLLQHGQSRSALWEASKSLLRGASETETSDQTYARLRDTSRASALGYSHVRLEDSASAMARGSARVNHSSTGVLVLGDRAVADVYSGRVVLEGSSVAALYGKCRATLKSSSAVAIRHGKTGTTVRKGK